MSLKKLLVVLLLFAASGMFATTWYSEGDGALMDIYNWNSASDGSGNTPTVYNFRLNDTWVIQSGHYVGHIAHDDEWTNSRRLGSGTKFVVESDAHLEIKDHLMAESGNKFGALEVYGLLDIDYRQVKVTDIKVFEDGKFRNDTDSLFVTNFYVYGGGVYEHFTLDPDIPGTNRCFADATNGGNGNGLVVIIGQDGALPNDITWGDVELKIWYSGADAIINDGAFADVRGDFKVTSTHGEYYNLMGTGGTTHNIKGNLIIDGGNLVLRCLDGTGAAYYNIDGDLELKSGRLIQSADEGGTVLTVKGDFNQTGGYYYGSMNSRAVNQLKLGGALSIAATGTTFKAFEDLWLDEEEGGGYLDIIFTAAEVQLEHDLKLPTGLDREQARWNISIKERRVITLKSNIEIGTTNYSTYAPHLQFTVGGEGTLKFGNYVVKNASGTFDDGFEPQFYLNSLGEVYISSAQGLSLTEDIGPVRVTDNRYYNDEAKVYYVGTSTQYTGDGIDALKYLELDNAAGLKLSADLTVADVYVKSGKLDPNGYKFIVTGTLMTGANGSLEPGEDITINGYNGTYGATDEYLTIAENEYTISNFGMSTNANGTYFPERIDRSWTINGTISSEGSKEFTFRWTEEDDNGFIWGNWWPGPFVSPVVYHGSEIVPDPWGMYMGGRFTSRTLSDLDGSKGVFTIGRSDGLNFDGDPPTTPVELSSFTATISADTYILLTWITQSETNMNGFVVYRNTVPALSGALAICNLIPAGNTSQGQIYTFLDTELYESGSYYYSLQSIEADGTTQFFGPVSVLFTPGGGSETPQIPAVTELQAVYPNPFNPTAYIPYSLAQDSEVVVSIHNSRGQLVRDFALGIKEAGNYRIEWNGKDNRGLDCGSGVYTISLRAGKQLFLRKAVLMK